MRRLIVLALLSCFFCVCSHAENVARIPIEKSGWLGADVAYSRLAAPAHRIWLFGDTFVGDLKDGKRVNGRIINNSIGVERGGKFQYFNGNSPKGFFVNQRKDEWYWPADSFVFGDTFYVFLRRVKKIAENDPFGFEIVGNDLAAIENFKSNPNTWTVKLRSISLDHIALGTAVAVYGKYVFMLVDDQKPTHGLSLARISLEGFDFANFRIEFYHSQNKQWRFTPSDQPLIPNGASEASLAFVPAKNLWRILLTPNGMSSRAFFYEAKTLTSTWKGPKKIFTCPEMATNPQYYCYSVKEVDTGGVIDFLFTYNVNSFDFWDLSRDPGIYIPRIVTADK